MKSYDFNMAFIALQCVDDVYIWVYVNEWTSSRGTCAYIKLNYQLLQLLELVLRASVQTLLVSTRVSVRCTARNSLKLAIRGVILVWTSSFDTHTGVDDTPPADRRAWPGRRRPRTAGQWRPWHTAHQSSACTRQHSGMANAAHGHMQNGASAHVMRLTTEVRVPPPQSNEAWQWGQAHSSQVSRTCVIALPVGSRTQMLF